MKVRRVVTKIELPPDFPLMPYAHDEVTGYLFHNYLQLFTPGEHAAYTCIILDGKNALSRTRTVQDGSLENREPVSRSKLSTYDTIKGRTQASRPEVVEFLADGNAAYYERIKERLFRDHADKIFLNRCPKCEALCKTPDACLCPNAACNHTWYETRK